MPTSMAQPATQAAPAPTPPANITSAAVEQEPFLWDLTRNQAMVFGAIVLAANLPLIHYFVFRPRAPTTVTLPFQDDFNRPEVGPNYHTIGGQPRIVNGMLQVPGVKNNPIWLNASLPQNVQVEFDARSDSTEGDIKVEIFGNGWDHASGYVLILGGWSNSISVLARLDEHGEPLEAVKARERRGELRIGPDTPYRVERRDMRVEPQRLYRFRIERRGGTLTWYIDNALFLQLDDPYPLVGSSHDRFGFSSWDSMNYFDNLSVTPL
jgi:hypothetical protein